jgi:nucleoside-diphosphate-sugar epimerase
MNAIATETRPESSSGIERYVFASSCSLYDARRPACTMRRRRSPKAAYATSALRRGACCGLVDDGLCPVLLRNGTVYGWSPRMRYDLVVNTFVKDALLAGRLMLHGGGRCGARWRVRDVSDALIAAYEAPAELVRGEIFNVLPQPPDPRAGTARRQRAARRPRRRLEESRPADRDYECSNAKLSTTLGFIPATRCRKP